MMIVLWSVALALCATTTAALAAPPSSPAPATSAATTTPPQPPTTAETTTTAAPVAPVAQATPAAPAAPETPSAAAHIGSPEDGVEEENVSQNQPNPAAQSIVTSNVHKLIASQTDNEFNIITNRIKNNISTYDFLLHRSENNTWSPQRKEIMSLKRIARQTYNATFPYPLPLPLPPLPLPKQISTTASNNVTYNYNFNVTFPTLPTTAPPPTIAPESAAIDRANCKDTLAWVAVLCLALGAAGAVGVMSLILRMPSLRDSCVCIPKPTQSSSQEDLELPPRPKLTHLLIKKTEHSGPQKDLEAQTPSLASQHCPSKNHLTTIPLNIDDRVYLQVTDAATEPDQSNSLYANC